MRLLFATLIVLASVRAQAAAPSPGRLRFRVILDGALVHETLNGRVRVAMTALTDPKSPFEVRSPQRRDMWLTAMEVAVLTSSGVEIDPDTLAWPMAFSRAAVASYKIAARLLRPSGQLVSGPVITQKLEPAHAGTIELHLDTMEPMTPTLADTATIKVVREHSELLSTFYGRPINMEAIVLLPPSAATNPQRRYPTLYNVPGFGGTLPATYRQVSGWEKDYIASHYPEVVHVFLIGMISSGHHGFADSVNDGPWGSALVNELIPRLEKRFPLVAEPRARVLGGHSSGGWASLWLQVSHPDFFGGTWSTAPDSVDFRSLGGVDVTPGTSANFYRTADGQPRPAMHDHERIILTNEEQARFESINGDVGVLSTFEWVFSPRGPRGLPLPIFDRTTGEIDREVARAWEKWDIRKVLAAHWTELGPKLRGKLHLFVGGEDHYFGDQSLALLCQFLASHGADATCETIPGKAHFDLSGKLSDPKSLRWRIEHESAAAAVAR
jgi:hypothetical protein